MATIESEYYDVLGVSRDASDADIKRAFRTLARELHPDVSTAPDADTRFKEIVEAYEVLSDSERRATYDRFGKAGLKNGGFEPMYADFGNLTDVFAAFFGDDLLGGTGGSRQRSQRGGDLQAVVEIDLEDAFTGLSVSVPLDVALPCDHCAASGAEPGTGSSTCRTCSGAGVVRSVSQNIFGQFVQQRACPDCGGVGEVLEHPCSQCRGDGRVVLGRKLEVDVPRGIHDGQQIRVRGEGHAGFRSTDRGNAFVVVRIRPDSRFVRDGDDLHTAVRVTMTDAALGTTTKVATPAGDIDLDVRAGAQPGEVRAIRGQGMPSLRGSRRGDLYVRLDVAVPTHLTAEQRSLLEDVDAKVGPEAYAPQGDEDEGFFHRLKSALR
ncbi:MAG: molecular chaperone DnaJ [Thermoleophilia bacterium]|nr:molecular chaperone DnaJ [Thermoleophilia bacterium]MDH5281028.1 molecular chaperone DnaJ [Thermoleophilia bacterium]